MKKHADPAPYVECNMYSGCNPHKTGIYNLNRSRDTWASRSGVMVSGGDSMVVSASSHPRLSKSPIVARHYGSNHFCPITDLPPDVPWALSKTEQRQSNHAPGYTEIICIHRKRKQKWKRYQRDEKRTWIR